jgi:hypothetical protein
MKMLGVRTSFLAKCKRDACAPKAVGSDGKPLKGAAKKFIHDEVRAGTGLSVAARNSVSV